MSFIIRYLKKKHACILIGYFYHDHVLIRILCFACCSVLRLVMGEGECTPIPCTRRGGATALRLRARRGYAILRQMVQGSRGILQICA